MSLRWWRHLTISDTVSCVGCKCSLARLMTIQLLGNSVVTDVQFGHLFLVCIKYVALQEVTCGLFRKISHCS